MDEYYNQFTKIKHTQKQINKNKWIGKNTKKKKTELKNE